MDPIVIGKAEIVFINYEDKKIGILIHHSYPAEELHSYAVTKEFIEIKNRVSSYIFDEFFDPGELWEDWNCIISTIHDSPGEPGAFTI